MNKREDISCQLRDCVIFGEELGAKDHIVRGKALLGNKTEKSTNLFFSYQCMNGFVEGRINIQQ